MHLAVMHNRWADRTATEFIKWGPGDPNDQAGTQLCVVFQITDGNRKILIYYCKHFIFFNLFSLAKSQIKCLT